MCRHQYLIAAAVGLLPLSLDAQTVSTQGTLDVRITISTGCQIVSIGALDFGTLVALKSAIDATGTLQVICTEGTAYRIGLSSGAGAQATTSLRKMTSGSGATINYRLFQDSARTLNWGNDNGDSVAFTGLGTAQSFTVYGQVPAQPAPSSGSYSDIVDVIITY